jgi:hypothetical protein
MVTIIVLFVLVTPFPELLLLVRIQLIVRPIVLMAFVQPTLICLIFVLIPRVVITIHGVINTLVSLFLVMMFMVSVFLSQDCCADAKRGNESS